MQFSYTREPLIEEYSVAAQIYKLSAVDMCELARNSVVQSGFEASIKARWLGEKYRLEGVHGNEMHKTNIPNVRVEFRTETHKQEIAMIQKYANSRPPLSPGGRTAKEPNHDVSNPNSSNVHASVDQTAEEVNTTASSVSSMHLNGEPRAFPGLSHAIQRKRKQSVTLGRPNEKLPGPMSDAS